MIPNDPQVTPPPRLPLAFTVQQIIRRSAYEAGLRQTLRKANEQAASTPNKVG